VFVLAYNLARPGTLERGVRPHHVAPAFGALASVPFVALGGLYAGWWPLNVMFTLLVVTATAYLVERGGKLHLAAAGVVFLVGGSSVEYWWPAVAFGLAVGRTRAGRAGPPRRSRCWPARPCGSSIATCGPWQPCRCSSWPRASMRVPRLRWAFYAYYPLHLAALWLIRIPMSKAGYLFF
jgi:hypothetical protein